MYRTRLARPYGTGPQSIDGVSAFDLISSGAKMTGLLRVEGGSAALPFVRMFYGAPSEYLWDDSCGTVHSAQQLKVANKVTHSCHCSSLSDSTVPMIQNRHPDVAGQLIAQLEGRPDTPIMRAASDATRRRCQATDP